MKGYPDMVDHKINISFFVGAKQPHYIIPDPGQRTFFVQYLLVCQQSYDSLLILNV